MSAASRNAASWPAKGARLWIGRKRSNLSKIEEARAAVSHLKPIVLVTGGSRGIGAALAMRFAEAGHDVALIARNSGTLAAAARPISEKTQRRVIELIQDISDDNAPANLETALLNQGFYVDVLINNAGIGLSGSFAQLKSEDLDALINLNIRSLTRLMRHFLPAMRARGQGGILNVSSLGGVVPGPYQAAYYASKSYVISLTEAVAAEVSGEGVRIAVLVPGPVNTTFHANMGAEGARYRWVLPAQSLVHVAGTAYRGFSLGQRVIIPGLFYRLAYVVLKVLPHPVSIPLMAWLLAPPRHTQE